MRSRGAAGPRSLGPMPAGLQSTPCASGAAAQPSGVEPDRCRQHRRVPLQDHGIVPTMGFTGSRAPSGAADRPGSQSQAVVQPAGPPRAGSAPRPAGRSRGRRRPCPAPEAVPALRVGVHREAALGLAVEGAHALADAAPVRSAGCPTPPRRRPSEWRPLTAARSIGGGLPSRSQPAPPQRPETHAGCGARPSCPAATASL